MVGRPSRQIFGSTQNHCLKYGHCSVLVVKNDILPAYMGEDSTMLADDTDTDEA